MSFLSILKTSWVGIFEIFLMGICGYILVRKKILPDETSKVLSKLVMELTLPLLIFYKMVTHFDFEKFSYWWVLPFVAVVMIFAGFILGKLFSKNVEEKFKKGFISLCAYQNSGYLPLALVGSMFKTEIADTLFIYIFLFLAGFNFLIWSVGVFYLKSGIDDVKLEWKHFFTPPFIAILLSLLVVAFKINTYIPKIILAPVSKVGASTIPLGIIAIGAILGEIRGWSEKLKESMGIIKIVIVKLIMLPLITFIVLQFVNLPKWMEFFIFLESLMPSATSLGVIARRYHVEYGYVANAVFITHIFSLITIPGFVVLYYKFFLC